MIIKDIVQKYGNKRENLLQILHEVQNKSEWNYLSPEALQELSEEMKIPLADIKGTASFYTMFSFVPRGKYLIRVCASPPCHIRGAQTIFKAIEDKLGIKEGETTKDGLFTLESTSCLGICGVAPAMMVNEEAYGNLTVEKINQILDLLREKESKQ